MATALTKLTQNVKNVNCAEDIILAGYVGEEEKWELFKNANVLLFPTFYEGFGLPILEAQSAGIPVVAGNNSSVKEITSLSFSPQTRRDVTQGQRGGENSGQHLPLIPSLLRRGGLDKISAILVDPHNTEEIADAAYKLISDENLRNDIINKGYENVKRFSWERCAEKIANLLLTI